MHLLRIACKVSFNLRLAVEDVTLSGKPAKVHPGEDNVTMNIPFGIKSAWSKTEGPYGSSSITFNWTEGKPSYVDEFGLSDESPMIDIVSIDGNGLSDQDREALEIAGLNDLVLAAIFADSTEREIKESELPKKSVGDWLV